MPSIQAKMISGLFKLIGVNRMLDKQGADFEKLLESYKEKQKKPLKIPYSKNRQRHDALLGRYGICTGSPGSQTGVF